MIDLELSEIQLKDIGENHSILTITPLPTGYGTTLGTALRRVALSSLAGPAITSIKIEGVTHEFSTISGVKDSIIDIIMNLREIKFIIPTSEPVVAKISVKKEGVIKASDLKLPADVEVVNPDAIITTLEKKTKLEMEVYIEIGVGFNPVISREVKKAKDPNVIEVDAVFSPIKKINYKVSSARVGQSTDLDKLEMEIQTNGSISPKDVLAKTAGILRNYFGLLDPEYLTPDEKKSLKSPEDEAQDSEEDEDGIIGKKSGRKYTPVEVLKFSPRTLNALINNKINSVEALITYNESKLSNLKGFGAKAMFEVKDALKVIDQTLAEDNQ